MRNLTVRNVPFEIARALGEEKARSGDTLNATVIRLLGKALGVADDRRRSNGLRRLSGTWTEAEQQAFDAAMAEFERTDDEVWR